MSFNRSSRVYRLLVGFISPPFLGSFLVVVSALLIDSRSEQSIYETLARIPVFTLMVFIGAIFFVGIQAFVYSLVMEFVVRPKVPRRSLFLVVSGLLGCASALYPGLVFTALPMFLPTGLVVGVIVGLLIYGRQTESKV